MAFTIMLMIHICCATVGLLSGYLAIGLRKGSGLHGATGNVFFVAMLAMSSSAASIAAFWRPNMLNVVVGLLTFYLVGTAWRTARRSDGFMSGPFDRLALLFIAAVAALGLASGFAAAGSPTGTKDGMGASIYFIFGSVALLCAVSDFRMLLRGGVFGPRRIARHLWRMCLALLIATMSLYPGQAQLFPAWLRETRLLMIPHVLLIGSMVWWRIRVMRRERPQMKQRAEEKPRAVLAGMSGGVPEISGGELQ